MPYIKQLITTYMFLLFIAAIIACNSQSVNNTEAPKFDLTKIETSDNPVAYGKWTMCSYVTGNEYTQFNVCPTILLNEDGSGEIIRSTVLSTSFNWALKNNILTTANKGNIELPFFSEGKYKAFITLKGDRFSLIVIDSVNNTRFYLSR